MRRLVLALAAALAFLAAPDAARADVVDDDLAAVSRGAGDVVVFARGEDGAVYMRQGIDGTWSSLGGEATSGPDAAVRPDGTIEVFVRGLDDAIWQQTVRGTTGSGWTSLGGRATTGPGAVQRFGRPEIDLFYAGPTRTLVHRWAGADGAWSPEEDLGGAIYGAPGPVSRQGNWLDVYVRGAGEQVYNRSYPNAPWADYSDVAGQTLSSPSAISRVEGDIDLYVRGTDRALYQRHFFGASGYRPWELVDPTPLTSGPAATVDGPNRVHVFARSGDSVLVKSFADGAGYAAWRDLGPVAPPPPPPPPPPTPVAGGSVEIGTGLSCTPQGKRLSVTVKVSKRKGRARPQVRRVVFYYRKGKRTVARTDRSRPFRRTLPVTLKPGTYRVYARIEYKRPGKRKLGRKVVSKRFAVCA